MSLQIYLEKMRKIQVNLLEFIEKEDNIEEHYQNLINIFDDHKVLDNQHQIKSILHLILNVANNHNRSKTFFSKIERVLIYFKDKIKQTLSNSSIFNLFKSNKKILLFLIEQNLLIIDQSIAKIMQEEFFNDAKYPQYFFKELEPFLDKQKVDSILREIPENYEEIRKTGENHSKISELIRNDSIEEFIIYVKKNGIVTTKTMDPSIFETNPLLFKKKDSQYSYNNYLMRQRDNSYQLTLIEYAAFFGSIQIFRFLNKNGCLLTPSLWIYAIHGQNPEIIQILQDNNIIPPDGTYEEIFIESIKCHHIEMTNYIQDNFLDIKTLNVSNKYIKYYNFTFIENSKIDDSKFYTFCKYDHYPIVEILLKEADIDAGALIVLNILFESSFIIKYFFIKLKKLNILIIFQNTLLM